MVDELDRLREKISQIDRDIIGLIAERLDVVNEIAAVKIGSRRPIRDYRVEREVIQRMRSRCNELGIDPAIGRLLARLLIGSAIRAQEGIVDRVYEGIHKRILIMGGHGRMGQWFLRYVNSMGHRVSVFDPAGPVEGFDYEEDPGKAIRNADMVLLSTPLGISGTILEEVVSFDPGGIIFDICSLKSHLLHHIRAAVRAGIRITSLHPMFGPRVRTLMERNVILCRCGCAEADQEVKRLFEGTEANLIEMDIEEHDERMAYVLGMCHAVNIMFSEMLFRSGKPLADLLKVASSTFTKQIKTTRDVAFEAADLYYEIQTLNDHTPEVFELFLKAAEEVHQAVREKDPVRFAEIMKRGKAYFHPRA
ncbi:MAG: prephenate dehydrogenase/arogenate dehydrogenase family protein [Candidatus Glassbacteria bacterium]